MTRLQPPIRSHLADPETDRVVRSLAECVAQLQDLPMAAARIVRDKTLEDGVETPIQHGMGRPAIVTASLPRGAAPGSSGSVVEIRSAAYDPRQVVVLRADGWGATVTVDLVFL